MMRGVVERVEEYVQMGLKRDEAWLKVLDELKDKYYDGISYSTFVDQLVIRVAFKNYAIEIRADDYKILGAFDINYMIRCVDLLKETDREFYVSGVVLNKVGFEGVCSIGESEGIRDFVVRDKNVPRMYGKEFDRNEIKKFVVKYCRGFFKKIYTIEWGAIKYRKLDEEYDLYSMIVNIRVNGNGRAGLMLKMYVYKGEKIVILRFNELVGSFILV